MIPPKDKPLYDLIDSQEMVCVMLQYSLHKQTTQIPFSLAFDEKLDFNLMAKAVNIEIKRNDCLRMRIYKHLGKMKTFFLDSYKLDKIPVLNFVSPEQRDAFLDADASTALDIYNGELFRVKFFREGGKSGIYLCASHMIMDAVATFVFFKDLMSV